MHCKCLRASESIVEKYAIRLSGQINIRLLLSLAYLNAQSIICLLVILSVIAECFYRFYFRDLIFLPRMILCQIYVLHPARSDNFNHQQIVSQGVNAAAVFSEIMNKCSIWKMNQKGGATFNSYITYLSFESFTFMIIYFDKMFCPLETLKADTIWIMISIKIRNHFRCCCYCALENLFLVKSSFAAFGTCHAFWTEALKHPPRSSQFFTSYTQSHSIIVLLLIQNIFKTFKGEVVFWQNSRQFLCCCKTLDSLRVRRRFKKQATCLFRFFQCFCYFYHRVNGQFLPRSSIRIYFLPFSHFQALYTQAAPGNELQPRFKIN